MPITVVAQTTPRLEVSSPTASTVGVFVARGERGADGAEGPQGPQGIQGIQGPAGADGTAAVIDHIADTTPHPTYDDIPSLALLFENRIS